MDLGKLLEEKLEEIVERVLERHLGELASRGAPAGGLASKREACRALRVSTYKLDELVKAGMPVVRLGSQSPRFDVAACVEWLKART